jgi:hypothetical protein
MVCTSPSYRIVLTSCQRYRCTPKEKYTYDCILSKGDAERALGNIQFAVVKKELERMKRMKQANEEA